ncbi:hypothetical protein K435DRAFT_857178 [Dendrothele bispora CBS 962.96]|uniref:Uncharacterized protein n=1 Tax=Dendrothele bispora (strain CBS 962.96) TaxID=1314807 RepID=A0A4S8M6N2_DENBC|nr:hypothetical protein K435DRAFT_857178 [Dendrothele bispora CBS 962.96]
MTPDGGSCKLLGQELEGSFSLIPTRHLTQDYPAFGENLSRASSRSSTVSQASRSAYPGVPEEILERVSQAKTARLAARARYEAALANPDLPNSVVAKLEDDLSKSEDELKFARIERMRAKFSNSHVTSPSRPSLTPPLLAPSPLRLPLQPSLQPVLEDPARSLEQGEELREWGRGTGVHVDEFLETTEKLKLTRTEHDGVELYSQNVTTLPRRSLLPSIPTSPLLQIASRLSSGPISEDPALLLEQGEDPRKRGHRVDTKMDPEDKHLQVADKPNPAKTKRVHAKPWDQSVATSTRSLTPPPLLTSSPRLLGIGDSALSMEQGGKPREPALDLDRVVHFKTGEEVGTAGGKEERTRSVHDSRAHLLGNYEHEHRSTIPTVPLGRELHHVPNVSRMVNRPAPSRELPRTQDMQQLAISQGPPGAYQHLHIRVQLSQGEDAREVPSPPSGNYALRQSRSPSFLGTTSTRGNVSWLRPRDLHTPVQHIVGGFGGGDPEGSSYHESSESDHGGGNGGGGSRPPSWWDDDPGDSDRNDKGQSGDHQPRRGRHGRDRNNEPHHGSCGGGPPGGDPPDDGEPEGGKDGNSERSNRKDSKRRRGVTPFSEIPEEGSPHYNYEYFEYKVKVPTNSKKPLKEKVFTRFAMLIEWRLFTKLKVVGDGKAQKNLINSIPKIELYKGQNSIVVLDRFLRDLIRHMEVHGLTGPSKTMDPEGTLVVTNEDTARTILMAANLTGAAQEWYQSFAERPPSSFQPGMKASAHRRTFLQVFRAPFTIYNHSIETL